MTLTLSPEAEAHLAAVAARRGLLPSAALDQILAEARARAEAALAPATPIWKRAAALGAAVSAEERANLPHDGSVNYEHYLYQAPMQPAPPAE